MKTQRHKQRHIFTIFRKANGNNNELSGDRKTRKLSIYTHKHIETLVKTTLLSYFEKSTATIMSRLESEMEISFNKTNTSRHKLRHTLTIFSIIYNNNGLSGAKGTCRLIQKKERKKKKTY